MKRDDILELIKDKVRGFYRTQKKMFVVTMPSTTFPNGKFYNGIVTNVIHDYFMLLDDVEGPVEISFHLVASPEDIQLSRRAS